MQVTCTQSSEISSLSRIIPFQLFDKPFFIFKLNKGLISLHTWILRQNLYRALPAEAVSIVAIIATVTYWYLSEPDSVRGRAFAVNHPPTAGIAWIYVKVEAVSPGWSVTGSSLALDDHSPAGVGQVVWALATDTSRHDPKGQRPGTQAASLQSLLTAIKMCWHNMAQLEFKLLPVSILGDWYVTYKLIFATIGDVLLEYFNK